MSDQQPDKHKPEAGPRIGRLRNGAAAYCLAETMVRPASRGLPGCPRNISHHRLKPALPGQTHRELDHAGAAAHNPGGGAHRSSRGAAYRRGDFTEAGAALVCNRIREVRVVEEIEEVRLEAEQ